MFNLCRAGSAIFAVWIWKISPKNHKISILRVIKNLIGSGQKYPGQRRVGLLFSAGQKYET